MIDESLQSDRGRIDVHSKGWTARLPKVHRSAWIAVCLGCFFVFLFTPKQERNCKYIVTIYDIASVPLNCDSRDLVRFVDDGSEFFTEFHVWKDRPVYFSYGFLMTPIVSVVGFPLRLILSDHVKLHTYVGEFKKYFSARLTYTLLNMLAVICAVWLALRMSGVRENTYLALALTAAIASSDIVAGGVWLVHTNVFNLVGCIACAFYFLLGYQRQLGTRKTMALLAAAGGLMVMVYPLLVILAPAYIVGMVYARLDRRVTPVPIASIARDMLLFSVIFAAPVVIWWALVRLAFDTPVYLTAQKGQFLWLLDALLDGQLFAALQDKAEDFAAKLAAHFTWTWWPPLIAGAAVIATARTKLSIFTDPVIVALACAALIVLSFNFFQGLYTARMHVATIALAYVAIARLADRGQRREIGAVALAAIACAQLVDASLTYTMSG